MTASRGYLQCEDGLVIADDVQQVQGLVGLLVFGGDGEHVHLDGLQLRAVPDQGVAE
jgi:hypothetical protein